MKEGRCPASTRGSNEDVATAGDHMRYARHSATPCGRPDNPVSMLRWRAEEHPSRRAFVVLGDGTNELDIASYADLDARARRVGSSLRARGAEPGDRVLLLLPTGLEFLSGYWGCLYAGGIAVPAPSSTGPRVLPRMLAILRDCAPRFVLGTKKSRDELRRRRDVAWSLVAGAWVDIDEGLEESLDGRCPHPRAGEGVALIQYTSGSTADPKGTVITHRNLFRNSEMIRMAMGHSETSRFVSWLPEYHDMGLIGNLMQPLHVGTDCVFMPPEAFLRNPAAWLQAISKYQAHTSGAPDFAYALCVERVSDAAKRDLDLSSWQVAYDGAEPVRARTLQAFSAAFACCGFSPRAFYPTYGLAEATLMVSGGAKAEPPMILHVSSGALAQGRALAVGPDAPDAVALVGCGRALDGEELAIVDPDRSRALAPCQIGEIWVCGDNVAAGYWGRSDEATSTFCRGPGPFATAPDGASGERRWLRTGDLGFLRDGQLFITGRLKDVMIFRGRKHHPHDIEAVVESCDPAISAGSAVALSIAGPHAESLCVLVEMATVQVRRHGRRALASIVAAVSESFGVAPTRVVLAARGSIPRTTSGKRQRGLCRERYQRGELRVLDSWAAEERSESSAHPAPDRALCSDDLEGWLSSHVATACNLDIADVRLHDPISSHGLDSIRAVALQHALEAAFGVRVPPSFFLRPHSIADVGLLLAKDLAASAAPEAQREPLVAVDSRGSLLSWGQRAIWFDQQFDPASAAYNVFFAVRVLSGITPEATKTALASLLEMHPVLSMAFPTSEAGPSASRARAGFPCLDVVRCDPVSDGASSDASVTEQLTDLAHAPFDLEHGPLLRLKWLEPVGSAPILLVVAHHIVMDLWSMAEFSADLVRLARTASASPLAGRAAAAVPYEHFVVREAAVLAGPLGKDLSAFWRARVGALSRLKPDHAVPRRERRARRGATYPFLLDPRLVADVRRAAREVGVTGQSLLLAAFALLIAGRTRAPRAVFGSVVSGRTRAEFMRTIGHFANPVVVNVEVGEQLTSADLLRRVHADMLDILDHQEFPFSLVVQECCPPRELDQTPLFQSMFVYQQLPNATELSPCILGHRRAEFALHGARLESVPIATRTCRYDFTIYVVDSGADLECSVVYDADVFREGTVAGLASDFAACVEALADGPRGRIDEMTRRIETSAGEHCGEA